MKMEIKSPQTCAQEVEWTIILRKQLLVPNRFKKDRKHYCPTSQTSSLLCHDIV